MIDDAPVRAPDFPAQLTWINAEAPISLSRDLAGSVVLIDFFTSSCINCLHVLPTLGFVEQRFAGRPFAVLGVHSGKYPAEQSADHVRREVRRLGIRHPVVVDERYAIWNAYAVCAWPTLCLVDPSRKIRFQGAGEPERERLSAAIEALLADADGSRVPGPRWPDDDDDDDEDDEDDEDDDEDRPAARPEPEPDAAPGRVRLRFPAGLAFDEPEGLVWIADTGHHRVLAVDAVTGALRHRVGTGRAGSTDGDFGVACFCAPRGLVTVAGAVFVADAGNHSIRRIDVDRGEVETFVGQGRLVPDRTGGLHGRDQGIASPWDVAVHGDRLLIAMAGVHQLWSVDLLARHAAAFAGSGAEGLQDGMRFDAALAQPAGLAVRGDEVAFVDSESSSLRVLDLQTELCDTLIGGGLFEFGDVGGPVDRARLQHPRGVAFVGDDLLVADTFNDALKRVDRRARTVETVPLYGSGLSAPDALAAAGETLLVADTGNHRVLRVDLPSGRTSELRIHDPHPDAAEPSRPPLRLKARAAVSLCFPIEVPYGERTHPDAPPRAQVRSRAGDVVPAPVDAEVDREGEWGILRDVATGEPGVGTIEVLVRYVTCADADAVCHCQELRGVFEVELADDGDEAADLFGLA